MHTIDKAKGIKSSSREFVFFHRQIAGKDRGVVT